MASNFKRLLILAVTLFWLLPAQSVLAAKYCDEVEESVSGLSEKKALNKIKTQLRLHLKDFKKEGQDYEGQLDIACLIGMYMSFEEPSDAKVLERFNRISDWVERIFDSRESAHEYLNSVQLYKDSGGLADREQETGYANSEWVILALAKNLPKINSAQIPVYPIDQIKDQVWCNNSLQSRRSLDGQIGKISNLPSSLDNWEYLGQSQYEKSRSQFKVDSKDLRLLCGDVGSITNDQLARLRTEYKNKAERFTLEYWANLMQTAQAEEVDWSPLVWLQPSCSIQPSENEVAIVKNAYKYKKIATSKDWYSKPIRDLITAADKNRKSLKRVAKKIPRCYSKLKTYRQKLEKHIVLAQINHKDVISKDIQSYWNGVLSGDVNAELERRIETNRGHVKSVTKLPKPCIKVSESEYERYQNLNELRKLLDLEDLRVLWEGGSIRLYLDVKDRTRNLLKQRFEDCSSNEKIASTLKQSEILAAKLVSKYVEWSNGQVIAVWEHLTKPGGKKYNKLWLKLDEICGEGCAPSEIDAQIIGYLSRDPAGPVVGFTGVQFGSFQKKVSMLARKFNQEIFLSLEESSNQAIEKWDEQVVESWNKLLRKKCSATHITPELSSQSLNPNCSYPVAKEKGRLIQYCQLKKLKNTFNSQQQHDAVDPGADSARVVRDLRLALVEVDSRNILSDYLHPYSALVVAASSAKVSAKEYEDIFSLGSLSSVVKEHGFNDKRQFEIALTTLLSRDAIGKSLTKNLSGCGGKFYDDEVKKLGKTRNFYNTVYQSICNQHRTDPGSIRHGEKACGIAHKSPLPAGVSEDTADTKDTKGKTQPEAQPNQADTDATQKPKTFSIAWRSVGDDWIRVNGEMGKTSPNMITLHEEGAEIKVKVWGPVGGSTQTVNLKVPCCDRKEIDELNDFIWTESGKSGHSDFFEIHFDLSKFEKDARKPQQPVEAEDKCYAIVLNEVGSRDSNKGLPLGLNSPDASQISELHPSRKIVYRNDPYNLGASIGRDGRYGRYVVAYIGSNYVVFIPRMTARGGMIDLTFVLPEKIPKDYSGMAIRSGPPREFDCLIVDE